MIPNSIKTWFSDMVEYEPFTLLGAILITVGLLIAGTLAGIFIVSNGGFGTLAFVIACVLAFIGALIISA